MTYDFNIPTSAIVLLAVAVLSLAYIAAVYLQRLSSVRRRRCECDEPTGDLPLVLPRVSVVVYARDEAENLEKLLTGILRQDYAGYFEVIVVNDGASTETEMTVTRLQSSFPHLHLTFTPDGARSLSRRKLAITLGVKAAKGDVVIVTDAATRVGSEKWIELMATPFTDDDVKVVLGYNAPIFSASKWPWRRTAVFDAFADTATWLASAVRHRPYRGDGTNLAFRRQIFFDNKGFSRSLNLREGVDDIFVHEIATPGNTAVQIAADSIGTEGHGHNLRKRLRHRRLSHSFTGRRLPKLSRRLMAAGEWLMWVCAGCAVAGAMLCGVANIVGWAIAAVIVITMEALVITGWRKTLDALGGPDLLMSLLYIVPMRPVRNLIVDLRCRLGHTAAYTWQ